MSAESYERNKSIRWWKNKFPKRIRFFSFKKIVVTLSVIGSIASILGLIYIFYPSIFDALLSKSQPLFKVNEIDIPVFKGIKKLTPPELDVFKERIHRDSYDLLKIYSRNKDHSIIDKVIGIEKHNPKFLSLLYFLKAKKCFDNKNFTGAVKELQIALDHDNFNFFAVIYYYSSLIKVCENLILTCSFYDPDFKIKWEKIKEHTKTIKEYKNRIESIDTKHLNDLYGFNFLDQINPDKNQLNSDYIDRLLAHNEGIFFNLLSQIEPPNDKSEYVQKGAVWTTGDVGTVTLAAAPALGGALEGLYRWVFEDTMEVVEDTGFETVAAGPTFVEPPNVKNEYIRQRRLETLENVGKVIVPALIETTMRAAYGQRNRVNLDMMSLEEESSYRAALNSLTETGNLKSGGVNADVAADKVDDIGDGVVANGLRLLSVGIDLYTKNRLVNSLNYAVRDAKTISDAFDHYGFKSKVLKNENGTKLNIMRNLVSELLIGKPGDKYVLYISAHGISDINGNRFVLTYTDDGKIELLSLSEIKELLKDHQGDVSVIIDTCFNKLDLNLSDYLYAGKEVIKKEQNKYKFPTFLLGSSIGEKAIESKKLKSSIATYTIVEYLKNNENSGEKTNINFDELFTYVVEQTPKLSLSMYGLNQQPSIW